MREASAAAPLAGAELLISPRAGELLAAALATGGRELVDWTQRGVHRRARSVSVLYDVTIDDGREELLVAHVATHDVPGGAVELTVGDARIHVWRYPEDPYLPGLPSATSVTRVREFLDGVGLAPGQVRLRPRTYRPTRRAVIEVIVTGADATSTPLFLKVLGGRTPERVRERTRAVAHPHRELHRAGLPVPAVAGVGEAQGVVALTAVAGRTLRAVLTDPLETEPDPGTLVDLTRRLACVPLDTPADPRGFAAAARHVADLCDDVPDLAPTIVAVAAAADAAGGPTGTVHGDLHDGQVLLSDGSLSGLLDVDGSGAGLIAHDAGRLIAYVSSIRDASGEVLERAERLVRGLFEGYGDLVGEDDLRRAVAGATLSLATGPGRSRQGDWRQQTRALIGSAAAWLDA